MVPVWMLLATLLAACAGIASHVYLDGSTTQLPGNGVSAIAAGLVLLLIVCTLVGCGIYSNRGTEMIDREVLHIGPSGRGPKSKKRKTGANKNGRKSHSGIREPAKGPDECNPSGLWGFRHIWAFCLALATFCNETFQVAKATAGWLVGLHDPFVGINGVSAAAAEQQSLGPNLRKKTTRRKKNGRKGHDGIREVCKGSSISNPSLVWGIRHIWAFSLLFAAHSIETVQVAKATASWLIGLHDPFEDTNIMSATTAEPKSPAPSRDSPHVTGGIWGVRHLCDFCCSTFAASMASIKVAPAILRWLVGCHDFVVDADIADSSSISSSSNSSDDSPKATKAGNSKAGVPSPADSNTLSSTTINISADATAGPQTVKQGPANSGKEKIGRKNKKKGLQSASTRAAGDEAAKTAEKEKEEEEDYVKVAGRSRGSRGKKRTAAGSSAPLSIKRTVQNGPELITGNILVRILCTALEKALLLPRWQKLDYQSSLSTLFTSIPDWMLNQYGKHPANVSPTAAFVMLDGLLGRKKRSYEDLVNECNKAGMADSLELLCRAMVASEMVQQQGSQKLLAELKAAMASKHENMTMQQLCKTFVLPLSGSSDVPDSVHCHVKKTLTSSLRFCMP